MPMLPPSPWREFLQALDAKMTEAYRLPCFGGFAVTLACGLSQLTFDIDILDVAPPRAVEVLMQEGGKGSPLAIKHKVYLDFVGIANPPYDYESRLRPMYEGAFQHLHPSSAALRKLRSDFDPLALHCGELEKRAAHRLGTFPISIELHGARVWIAHSAC